MNDVLTMARKELTELLGNRHAARASALQAGIVLGLIGVLMPGARPDGWFSALSTQMVYLFYPALLSATIAADAFAGEGERRTLETLLATPLPDHAIYLGKGLAALAFTALVLLGTLLLSLLTIAVRLGGATPGSERLLGLFGEAVGTSLLSIAAASSVSMRSAAVRSAQQAASMVAVVITIVLAYMQWRMDVIDNEALLRSDVLLLGAGVAAQWAALRGFNRERFFKDRSR